MILTLKRTGLFADRTIGELRCGPKLFFTLEDQVRPDPIVATAINEAKVPGTTAIPEGRYDLIIDYSPRFHRELPHILDVPGFTGVRIHPGNFPGDTEGCILIGRSLAEDMTLRGSRLAFEELLDCMELAYERGETLSIEITTEVRA